MRAAAVVLLWCAGPFAGSAFALTITLPLRLGLAQVRQGLIEQVYREPGEQCTLLDDHMGCRFLRLWEPRVDAVKGRMRIMSRGSARLGTVIDQHCTKPLEWNGNIELWCTPLVDAEKKRLTWKIDEIRAYNQQHQQIPLNEGIWEVLRTSVIPPLEAVNIDLAPPITEIVMLVPHFFPARDLQTNQIMSTLAIRQPRLLKDSLGMKLSFQLPPKRISQSIQGGAEETRKTLRVRRFERWDAFLTFVIKRMARNNPGPVRRQLLGILLDARHQIVEKLAEAQAEAKDPVPGLFAQTWPRLKPILKHSPRSLRHDQSQPDAVINIGDSIAAFAGHSSDLDIEVSDEGLRAFARVIDPESTEDPVSYSTDVDPELRRLLGFGEPLPLPHSSATRGSNDEFSAVCGSRSIAGARAFKTWILSQACAATESNRFSPLNSWIPATGELNSYLLLVRELLQEAIEQTIVSAQLDVNYHGLYRNIVLATAWQESCWRQFTRAGDKMMPLTSSGGSVGLMQINQVVWRGIYDQAGLLKDMFYNGRAGCEILVHYLKDFALAKKEHLQEGGTENLARATYAVYNGGPAHLTRYRMPETKPSLKKIDALWWQKYQAVRDGREMEVAQCYR